MSSNVQAGWTASWRRRLNFLRPGCAPALAGECAIWLPNLLRLACALDMLVEGMIPISQTDLDSELEAEAGISVPVTTATPVKTLDLGGDGAWGGGDAGGADEAQPLSPGAADAGAHNTADLTDQ